MTLEDNLNTTTAPEECINNMTVGDALRDLLTQAGQEGRITCGLYDSGKILETNPEGVMLCILPDNVSVDVTMHIHFTLIQAFCWENDVRLVKVDSSDKLAKVLGGVTTSVTVNDNERSGRGDFNCVLVQYPTSEVSEAEEDVMMYHKKTCDVTPQPVIPLKV